MTDAQRIYRSIVDFIDQQTPGLPAHIGLAMVRSYCSLLAEPEVCVNCQRPLSIHGGAGHVFLKEAA